MKRKERFRLVSIVVVLLALCGYAVILLSNKQNVTNATKFPKVEIYGLKVFNSFDELTSLISKYYTNFQFTFSLNNLINVTNTSNPESILDFEILKSVTGFAKYVTGSSLSGTTAPESAISIGSLSYSTTNVRTEGIDEPDIFKSDGKYFYLVRNNKEIKIILAYPPKDMKIIKSLDIEKIINNLTKNKSYIIVNIFGKEEKFTLKFYVYVSKLYVTNDYLIAIVTSYPTVYRRFYYFEEPITWILVFKKYSWELEKYYWISGEFQDARLKDNVIYLVTYTPTYLIRSIVPLVKNSRVPIDHIGYVENTKPETYTTILAYDIKTGKSNVISILGPYPSILYMTDSGNIYLVFNEWYSYYPKSTIVKIYTDKLNLKVVNKITINGTIPNIFAIDEYEGYLRIAVNARKLIKKYYYRRTSAVDLYIFDENLRLVSKLNITLNERIYATRFMGDRLYIVTYRQIDPLFTIDLSDPKHPKIIGYLEGPGFDEYLHPISKDMLVGVGRSENWNIRISTYKLTVKGIKLIDRLELPYSTTPIFYPEGYRAFVINKKEKYILLPVAYYWQRYYIQDGILHKTIDYPDSGIAVIYYDDKGNLTLKGIVKVNLYYSLLQSRAAYIKDVCYGIGEEIVAFNCTTLEILKKLYLY